MPNKFTTSVGIGLFATAAAFAHGATAQSVPTCPQDPNQYCDVDDLPVAVPPTRLIYSPQQGLLIVNNGIEVLIVDVATHAVASHAPIANYFNDIAISPSGRYVFAADFSGDNFGPFFGAPPPYTNYIHRLDLTTRTWEAPETSYAGGNVQAVADDQVIVKPRMQFANLVNERWTFSTAMLPLNAPSANDPPAYDTYAYGGDFRYLPESGRLLIGSSGSSSREIDAFRLTGDNFVTQETTGVYGSAQNYGDTVALATDNSGFYYGALEVDLLDVTHQLRIFPSPIYAATGDVAFGMWQYYDVHTGLALGVLGVTARVYGLTPQGNDLWVFDEAHSILRRFVKDAIFADAFGD